MLVSLDSIDKYYKKIERIVFENAMVDISTTGMHIIKLDYLDFRITKFKAIFTSVRLWEEVCALINIDKGGREFLNGTGPEIDSLEAAMFSIMIHLYSHNPANKDLGTELTSTLSTPAGLMRFMDTRYGYIADEREFLNIRYKIANKPFDDKVDVKKHLSSLRRETTIFNRIYPQLNLEIKIANIDDEEMMHGVIEALPSDFKT